MTQPERSPAPAGRDSKPSAELTLQAIARVVEVMLRNYPGDAIAIRKWYSSYDHLVFVVSVSVATALMVGGTLGESTEDDVEPDSDDGSDLADSVDLDTLGADDNLEGDVQDMNDGPEGDEDDSDEDDYEESNDDDSDEVVGHNVGYKDDVMAEHDPEAEDDDEVPDDDNEE